MWTGLQTIVYTTGVTGLDIRYIRVESSGLSGPQVRREFRNEDGRKVWFETDLHEPLRVRSVLVCGSAGLEGWIIQVKSSKKDLAVQSGGREELAQKRCCEEGDVGRECKYRLQ